MRKGLVRDAEPGDVVSIGPGVEVEVLSISCGVGNRSVRLRVLAPPEDRIVHKPGAAMDNRAETCNN